MNIQLNLIMNNLDKFFESFSFMERSKILFEYFIKEEEKSIFEPKIKSHFDHDFYRMYTINEGSITKITDNYCFVYSIEDKIVKVIKYDSEVDSINTLKYSTIPILYNLGNISVYDNLDLTYTIYACFSHDKKINIFNFNLVSGILTKSKEVIINNHNYKFIKAIQATETLVITADYNNRIGIWLKNNESKDGFENLKDIILSTQITGILPVNHEFFISSHHLKKRINFYDIESLSIKKSLSNIDCIDNINSLMLFNKDFIVVNCIKGFSIISVKTKEAIQYIENFCSLNDKEFFNTNQYICILYSGEYNEENSDIDEDEDDDRYNIKRDKIVMKIYILKFNEVDFQLVEKFEKTNIEKKMNLMCLDDKMIILWDKIIYYFSMIDN